MACSRTNSHLNLRYSRNERGALVVTVCYNGQERAAEANWDSIREAMDYLMVRICDRIELLQTEGPNAPTEQLYNEFLIGLERLTASGRRFQQMCTENGSSQQQTQDSQQPLSGKTPSSEIGRATVARTQSSAEMGRTHFSPCIEISPDVTSAVIASMIQRQFISPASQSAMMTVLGWSEARRNKPEQVVWLGKNYMLRFLVLFLLGEEKVSVSQPVRGIHNLYVLQAGVYGCKPIVQRPVLDKERRWQIVAANFVDSHGRAMNASSLRSTRYPEDESACLRFQQEVLSCFAPLFATPTGRSLILPLPDGAVVPSRIHLAK